MPASTVGPKKPPTGKGVGKGKIAGLPIPVVLGGVVVAVLVGLYIKNKAAASTTAGTTTAATDPNAVGGGTAGSSTSPDSTQALADAINGLSYYLGGGGSGGTAAPAVGGTLDTSAPSLATVTNSATTAPTAAPNASPLGGAISVAKQTGANVYVTPGGSVLVGPDAKMAGGGANLVNLSQQIPVATDNFAQAAVAKSNALAAAGSAQPYGGVKSTVTNKKTGVTTTTYASGRIVQQKAGSTAYVAKK